MNTLKKIFKTNRPTIGMIHFPPLIGYKDFPGFEYIEKKATKEAKILENAGFDAIMVENNYDIPHSEFVPIEVTTMMSVLTQKVCETVKIPVGVSTLWNDYHTSLAICGTTRASFFRVPAYVDSVTTSYGIMNATAKKVVELRKRLNLENVAILADVQVKHSQMIDENKTLSTSIKEAFENQADAIIITGKWTGDSPKISDLEEARNAAENRPILIGSGTTRNNLKTLLKFADGVIVGTSLKEGESKSKKEEVNLKPFQHKLDTEKVTNFKEIFDHIIHSEQ